MRFNLTAPAALLLALSAPAFADAEHYSIDIPHTYVSFEAPHIEGISIWRGKFDRTQSGTIVLDRKAHTGTVDIVVDTSSIDFGLDKMNEDAKGAHFFEADKFPTATYHADSVKFDGDVPVEIDGQLTLHGVTRPLALKIDLFKCIVHPMLKVPYCGADATAAFDRADFGMDYGVKMGVPTTVKLQIQVEAKLDEKPGPQH